MSEIETEIEKEKTTQFIFTINISYISLHFDHFLFTETRTNQHLNFFPQAITTINTDTSITSSEQSLRMLQNNTYTDSFPALPYMNSFHKQFQEFSILLNV